MKGAVYYHMSAPADEVPSADTFEHASGYTEHTIELRPGTQAVYTCMYDVVAGAHTRLRIRARSPSSGVHVATRGMTMACI